MKTIRIKLPNGGGMLQQVDRVRALCRWRKTEVVADNNGWGLEADPFYQEARLLEEAAILGLSRAAA